MEQQKATSTVYEIVNPSDPYTLRAAEKIDACAAVCAIGQGHYALRDLAGKQVMPIFLFGDFNDWWREQFGDEDLGRALDRPGVIEALDSVLIGHSGDRTMFEAAIAKMPDAKDREAYAAQWHEHRCTSVNDIGAKAKLIADRLRNRKQPEPKEAA